RAGFPASRLAVLLHVEIARRRQPVDHDRPALRPPVGPHRQQYALAEARVEIALEEIGRLHDVHIGIDEPQVVFHWLLLQDGVMKRARLRYAAPETVSMRTGHGIMRDASATTRRGAT